MQSHHPPVWWVLHYRPQFTSLPTIIIDCNNYTEHTRIPDVLMCIVVTNEGLAYKVQGARFRAGVDLLVDGRPARVLGLWCLELRFTPNARAPLNRG